MENPINELVLCVDLSKYDIGQYELASKLMSEFQYLKKITLFHNIRLDYLNELSLTTEDIQLLRKKVYKELEARTKEYFSPTNKEIKVVVEAESSSLLTLEHTIGFSPVKLFLAGMKKMEDGSGVFVSKLFSFNPSPILLVPKAKSIDFRRPLIATDFSPRNVGVFKFLNNFKSDIINNSVAMYIEKRPNFYFPFLNLENSATINSSRYNNQFVQFLTKYRLDYPPSQFKVEKTSRIEQAILNNTSQKYDSVIIGRLGSNDLPKNQVGGLVRRLLHTNLKVPLLVV